uniref:NADH:flavin oxidoreductase/NADH oxidase N-terminal domain-containing protein n=1 Tax=Ditylenchus dipsaci TaxID=166011 RepID=A0A915EDX4_9BILA
MLFIIALLVAGQAYLLSAGHFPTPPYDKLPHNSTSFQLLKEADQEDVILKHAWEPYSRKEPVSATPLNQPLYLPTSKATVKNRIMKAALTEHLGTFTPEKPFESGLPTQATLIYTRSLAMEVMVFSSLEMLWLTLLTSKIRTEVVERFAFAAKAAYNAGFHGVQLHGAHGYLLAQFLSPTTNLRTDQYGGSPENRLRVVIETYNAIRKEVPADDAAVMAEMIDQAGFDFIELSGGPTSSFSSITLKSRPRKEKLLP